MLIPAILKREEIMEKFQMMAYTDDMSYLTGSYYNWLPTIDEEPGYEMIKYAVVNETYDLIGYFQYRYDRYVNQASEFLICCFDKGNIKFGRDVAKEINNLIYEKKIHRLEFEAISTNPVVKTYDRFVKKYNGTKHIFHDALKDMNGKYCDRCIYEIIF